MEVSVVVFTTVAETDQDAFPADQSRAARHSTLAAKSETTLTALLCGRKGTDTMPSLPPPRAALRRGG
jgi:hypothetical protein